MYDQLQQSIVVLQKVIHAEIPQGDISREDLPQMNSFGGSSVISIRLGNPRRNRIDQHFNCAMINDILTRKLSS